MENENDIRLYVTVSVVLLVILFLMPMLVIEPCPEVLPQEAMSDPEEESAPVNITDNKVFLKVLKGKIVERMELEEYLTGVVRAEMPATFEQEALKAQAVAARTYTIYKVQSGGNHGDIAQVCTDSSCCQAYMEETAARENWGEAADSYGEKVVSAVRDTAGEVVLYAGEPILAVFHAASAGLTRTADTVWQQDLPYLRPVFSPEEHAAVPDYYSRVEFTAETFRQRVQNAVPEVNLSGAVESWLQKAATDAVGNVTSVTVGGISVKGSQLRSILGLRSACFTWEVQEGKIVFFVTGYGHGVGLSQYGANQMAKEGKDYRDILCHYYTGVTVEAYPFTNMPSA